nr:sialate O-acetylesterase [Paenibacillus bovis]
MKLSTLISNGMVLQRNEQIAISGKTEVSKEVSLSFLGETYTTLSNHSGEWSIELANLQPGGPYEMEISTEDERVVISDILIGDVWVLGGQSNMELPINRTLDLLYDEVKDINEPNIRQFNVPQIYDFKGPRNELDGGSWMNATGENVMNFSAVGYFFAQKLYKKHGVPIGLIHTAVGGTPIEAWMSEKTLREIGGYDEELDQIKDDAYVRKTKENDEKRMQDWHRNLNEKDIGLQEHWFMEEVDTNNWSELEVPNTWENSDLDIRGAVWCKREFEVPKSLAGTEAKLYLGTLIDADQTYINGTLVGTTGYRYPPRRYSIPAGVLREGKNSITVRVISSGSAGGFIKDMPYKIAANEEELSLEGTWKYKIGAITEPLGPSTFFQYKPTGVYNAMITPLRDYRIKGFAWYQGESNTGRPIGYSNLFAKLVKDWRENWGQGDLPFLFTQLTSLDTGEKDANFSHWALLRDEQRLSLHVPNTAMAVIIDAGEHNDLHPQDKKTVGERLALGAMKIAYGEDLVYSGPLYEKMEIIDGSIHLYFTNIGSGLVAHGGELKTFVISGEDENFVPAKAEISGDKVIVSSNHVKQPTNVRYAWASNPEGANLYNKEGLPASPFTTEIR